VLEQHRRELRRDHTFGPRRTALEAARWMRFLVSRSSRYNASSGSTPFSKPGANRLCLDLGHKAIAAENPPPRVQLLFDVTRMHKIFEIIKHQEA